MREIITSFGTWPRLKQTFIETLLTLVSFYKITRFNLVLLNVIAIH